MVKASDIPDSDFLASIQRHSSNIGASIGRIEADFPASPPKVVLAKARSLLKRGLISGCGCGCRGDFRIKEAPSA